MHDFDGNLQLELDVRQSVIEIEQRRVHLRFAWRALENEWNIDFPSAGRRRLRVIRLQMEDQLVLETVVKQQARRTSDTPDLHNNVAGA